jgi:outer membrane protein OmpA-like peptidoglycan-associated protein
MRCNPLRWLWGLLPLSLLLGATVFLQRPPIEAELGRAVEARLKQRGLDWAKVALDGRDATLTGRANDEAEQQDALALAASTWGVRTVANKTELIDKADAYAWSARRDGNRLVIAGLAPNETTRSSILSNARGLFPGVEVVDQMRLARGVPTLDTWLTGVNFGLRQLATLRGGEAKLDGLGLSLAGEAPTEAAYRGAKSALQGQLPRGVRLVEDKVTPPVVRPYVWAATSAGGRVTMTGHVPSDAVRSDLRTAARAAFPRGGDPVDQTSLGAGEPAGFPNAASIALRELGKLEEGRVDLRDTGLTIAGMAPDLATRDSVRTGLRGLPASIRLTDQVRYREPPPPPPPPLPITVAPPVITPYTGGVEYDGQRVVLTGHVPNAAAREAVTRAARERFPGRPIEDQLTLASGEPTEWVRCFDGTLLGVARLGGGRGALVNRRIEITGRTEDQARVVLVPRDVRAAVDTSCDVESRIVYTPPAEPDLAWSATYTGTEVVLAGDVSSAETKAALMAQARRQFPNVPVRDDMRIVPSRSTAWPKAAEAGLAALVGLKTGRAELARQQLTVTGEAASASQPDTVRTQVSRDVPAAQGYAARSDVVFRAPSPAERCQEELRKVARTGVITFETASAEINPDSQDTLNALADAARACPRLQIEIEGHTDSEGTPERNQRLSDRRAAAIRTFLVRAGVDETMLTAVGYGETQPLVPNDTPENRAKNRRIEFTVRP